MKSETKFDKEGFIRQWIAWSQEEFNPLSQCLLRTGRNADGEEMYYISIDDFFRGREYDFAPSEKAYQTQEQAFAALGRALDSFGRNIEISDRSFLIN